MSFQESRVRVCFLPFSEETSQGFELVMKLFEVLDLRFSASKAGNSSHGALESSSVSLAGLY